MPIDKFKCFEALKQLTDTFKDMPAHPLSAADAENYGKMCNDGVSVADLFRSEIPKKGTCSSTDADDYIKEEESQMARNMGVEKYNMDNISVAEHVLNEQKGEPEHAMLYAQASGDVKFFQEFLEGHHLGIGCAFGFPNQVPPDDYYAQLAIAREEARQIGRA